jgi:hypothetical protein
MLITADAEQPLILHVGDRLVEGWLVEPACDMCGGPRVYFLAFDATCCPSCNTWLEIRCQDPDCIHCQCRPERPLP